MVILSSYFDLKVLIEARDDCSLLLETCKYLLDHNFVSEIDDAGLASLVSAKITTRETQYNSTVPSDTFYYVDPEYQRTGSIGTKSYMLWEQ